MFITTCPYGTLETIDICFKLSYQCDTRVCTYMHTYTGYYTQDEFNPILVCMPPELALGDFHVTE